MSLALMTLGLPAQAEPEFTEQTLHFKVDVGKNQSCDIVGDLYTPREASPSRPVPAILTTNGFGGSKDDQSGIGEEFAQRGYAVLSYSGLGFGGSGCKITLDDRPHDGRAASQLVSYLGGADGIAYEDARHTEPAPTLDVVKRDNVDQDGKPSEHDPRVGMVGGSYGGHVQYAAAAIDKRIDTVIPVITWNDLEYSLAPNTVVPADENAAITSGAPKLIWAVGFTALGIISGLQHLAEDPSRTLGCPNFDDFVCTALTSALVTGVLPKGGADRLHNESVAAFSSDVTVPTLLIQGQDDTLFNLNEAAATYRALKEQGTTAKMVWMNGGHSGENAPGEIDLGNPDPASEFLSKRIADWFDHYLKDQDVGTGPEFSYFRDWIDYDGSAEPAYASSSSYPVGEPRAWALSGDDLVTGEPQSGRQSLTTTVGKLPTSLEAPDLIGDFVPFPESDLPGTTATWSTDELEDHIDVVGSPELDVRVDFVASGLVQALDAGKLVLFAKIYDVAPDGSAKLVRNHVAPMRVPDVNEPFSVVLPGIVHRFEPGHKIRLTIAGGSVNYLGNTIPGRVSFKTGSDDQQLTLPVVGDTPNSAGSHHSTHDNGGDSVPPSASLHPAAGHKSADDETASSSQSPVSAADETGRSDTSELPMTGGSSVMQLLAGLVTLLFGAMMVLHSRYMRR